MSNHRVFVTGASGYLGSAIVARLLRAGHEVTALTRNAENAARLEKLGAKPVVGDLADASAWLGVLQNCDSAVHAAAAPGTSASEFDHHALEAFRAAALDGRVRRVLYTSSLWVLGPTTGVADESAPLKPLELATWRAAHEEIVIDLAAHEVAAIILRPGMVYGGMRGLFGQWFAEAQGKRTITYPGDGSQHWPLVHREDVAEAYALALEDGQGGQRYVLCDESHHTVKQLAEAAATAAGARAVPMPADEVVKTMGLFGKGLLNDSQVTSAKARRELGWVPRHASFVHDAPALWREWTETKATAVS